MRKGFGLLVLPLLLLSTVHAQPGKVTYVYTDPQGTPLAEADANGNITATFDYKPYGSQVMGSPSSGPGYTGHVNDPDTGLIYMSARYYDSETGRFLSVDPLPWRNWQMGDERMRKRFSDFLSNPMSMNVYSYVDDNPINKIDPTGLKGCKSGGKSFQECTITITYDPASSRGKLVVTGKADGDKGPTVLLESSVVVGGDGHVTPVGTFTASRWGNDHVSKLYGHWANTPYSKTIFGMNAFGPHQLHIKELESRGIYIHGTMGPNNSPFTFGNSILSSTSHGCVRMCNLDNNALYNMMPSPKGNAIVIISKPDEN